MGFTQPTELYDALFVKNFSLKLIKNNNKFIFKLNNNSNIKIFIDY